VKTVEEAKRTEESESEKEKKEKVNEKEADEEEDKPDEKPTTAATPADESSEEEKRDGNEADSENSSAIEEPVKPRSELKVSSGLKNSSYVIRSPIGDIVIESPYDLDSYNLDDITKLQKWFKSCIIRKKLQRLSSYR